MTAASTIGASLTGGEVGALFLVLLRCTGLVVAAPILGHRSVPAPVKAGLAAVLALGLVRLATVAPNPEPLIIAAPVEVLIGLGLGFTLGLGFHAVEIGGRLLSLQMGLSLGSVFNPLQGEGGTSFDPFFAVLAGLLFLALDLHTQVVVALAHTFAVLPLGGSLPVEMFAVIPRLTALVLELGVRVAMPIAIVLLLAELAVALVARAIPQVNVFFLGLPLKILLGLAATAAALPNLAAGAAAIYRFVFAGATGGLAGGLP